MLPLRKFPVIPSEVEESQSPREVIRCFDFAPLLKSQRWLEKMEMSQLRFAPLDMTRTYGRSRWVHRKATRRSNPWKTHDKKVPRIGSPGPRRRHQNFRLRLQQPEECLGVDRLVGDHEAVAGDDRGVRHKEPVGRGQHVRILLQEITGRAGVPVQPHVAVAGR